MKSILVFSAAGSLARENCRKTVLNPIPEDVVYGSFSPEKRPELKDWRDASGGFYAWGLKNVPEVSRMHARLEPGDCVLGFFDSHYRLIARLTGKTQNTSLAATLWGAASSQWSNLIFITKPKEISVPATLLSHYLPKMYQSTIRISNNTTERIISNFGTLDAFVQKYFEPPSE